MVRDSSKVLSRTEEGSEHRGTFAAVTPAEAAGDSRVRRSTVELFDKVQRASISQGWSRAAALLASALREERSLHSRERRFVGDGLHRMIRGLRRLQALSGISRPGALPLYLVWLLDEWLAGGPAEAGVPEELSRALRAAGVSAAQVVDRAREMGRFLEGLSIATPMTADDPRLIERLGEALSYPDWLVQEVLTDYGPGAALCRDVLSAQNQRAPLTVRVNTLRGTREQLAARLVAEGVHTTPTRLSPLGLILHTRVNVYGLHAFQEGFMELQDEGSQLIAELVAPPPGSTVVDACAGAGGKTLALSGLMENRGRLFALDIEERKLAELRKRARRAGLTNVQAMRVPASGPDPSLIKRGAERVLLDAPCSGVGVLRRNAEARWRLRKKDLDELPLTQRMLLDAAARLVAPHGRLIYATCTILRRENENVIADFLAAHPEFSEVPIREIVGSARAAGMGTGMETGIRMKLLPTAGQGNGQNEDRPDGFFAAVLRRARS